MVQYITAGVVIKVCRAPKVQAQKSSLREWMISCVYTSLILEGCSGGQVVSTSASHQCDPGSIPGWGSDPGAVSEKDFVPV